MEKEYKWYLFAKALSEINFNDENLAEITIAGKELCIAKTNEKIYACAAICPHAARPLITGYINPQHHIVCSWHCYKFSLKNGRNVSGEGYFLKIYPVEERTDGWYVGIY